MKWYGDKMIDDNDEFFVLVDRNKHKKVLAINSLEGIAFDIFNTDNVSFTEIEKGIYEYSCDLTTQRITKDNLRTFILSEAHGFSRPWLYTLAEWEEKEKEGEI